MVPFDETFLNALRHPNFSVKSDDVDSIYKIGADNIFVLPISDDLLHLGISLLFSRDLSHVHKEIVIQAIQIIDSHQTFHTCRRYFVIHRKSTETLRACVIRAFDMDELGLVFSIKKNSCSLFTQVGVLRLVMRQILMIGEDLDFATANDLVKSFDSCKKFLSCDCVLQLRFVQLSRKSTDDCPILH